MSSPGAGVIGHQRPRLFSSPPGDEEAGQLAADLYELAAGHPLDDWQVFSLKTACRELADGMFASETIGLVVSRQNGKTEILIARMLAGVFLFGEKQIVYSAHLFATSVKTYRKLKNLIRRSPELHAQVLKYNDSHGQEGIEFKNGALISFVARTKGAARGDTVDLLVLDEAFDITEAEMSAMAPTQLAVPNSQRWFASSAPNAEEHPNARVFAGIREQGLAAIAAAGIGTSPSTGITWLEWSCPEGADPTSVESMATSNPALGTARLTVKSVRGLQATMTPKSFAVEILAIGDWPKPEIVERIIERPAWLELVNRQPEHTSVRALGIDMTPDQKWCSVSAASLTTTAAAHVEVGYHGRPGPQVVDLIVALVARWDPVAVVLDPSGPVSAIVPELVAAGIEPETTSMQQMAQACGGFVNAASNRLLSHTGDPLLDDALAGARKRMLTGGESWALKRVGSAPISPLVSALLARWGLVTFGSVPKPPPPPAPMWTPTSSASSETDDLATMAF